MTRWTYAPPRAQPTPTGAAAHLVLDLVLIATAGATLLIAIAVFA